MPDAREYTFSEASQLCIVQGRFEALALGSPVIEPGHLALGILKAIGQPEFVRLFPDPGRFPTLCQALGSGESPAPVSADDVTYTEAAIAAINGAYRCAGSSPKTVITPLHILLGIHRPESPEGHSAAPSVVAALLDAAGLSTAALEGLLAVTPASGRSP